MNQLEETMKGPQNIFSLKSSFNRMSTTCLSTLFLLEFGIHFYTFECSANLLLFVAFYEMAVLTNC